ncbi:hypothetical protein [Rhizobium sp. GCM10022189]|uniref:hypothetical protein n=1 Tax=Rhizobium sp. GCM10022189 TaxID=3252654 RepID=UPI0036200AC1
MANNNDDSRAVSDGPNVKSETWFALAIAAFIITVLLFAGFGIVVITAVPNERVQIAQAFTPFGAGLAAIVTFFTVAWRGVLNTRQLEYQAEQLAHARRQIESNDSANYARLLQDGAKLLGEKERQASLLAGIASLDIVIADPERRYGVEAMDLLADYVATRYGSEKLDRPLSAALRALANGEERGIISRVSATFERGVGATLNWLNIRGFKHVTYEGGVIRGEAHKRANERKDAARFVKVTVIGSQVVEDDQYIDCNFTNCRIRSIDASELVSHEFTNCDFSGAEIRNFDEELLISLDAAGEQFKRNYFYSDDPPITGGFEADWTGVLTAKKGPRNTILRKRRAEDNFL